MRDRDWLSVERNTLLTTQVIWFDMFSYLGDPYYHTPPSMNGSLRLHAMIARRVRERASNRRADRANRADGIAATMNA
jgi:hypothetical protein